MTPRPLTLRQVAELSDSFEEFGRHFQDWLHTVRSYSSRPQLEAAFRETPPKLARRFPEGDIADAWLAAYAEHAAMKIGRPVPEWTEGRVATQPWFATAGNDTRSRVLALRDSPPAFKSRNLYTPAVDVPWQLCAGRPAKTAAERREANAERQRRFRARQQAELRKLRRLTFKGTRPSL